MGEASLCLYAKGKEKWRMREDVGKDWINGWSKFSEEKGHYGSQCPGGRVPSRVEECHSSLETKETRFLQIQT